MRSCLPHCHRIHPSGGSRLSGMPKKGSVPGLFPDPVEPVTGIEPAPPAWEAGSLPLTYTGISPVSPGRHAFQAPRCPASPLAGSSFLRFIWPVNMAGYAPWNFSRQPCCLALGSGFPPATARSFPRRHRFPPVAFGPNRERCHALTFMLRYRGSIDLCVEISSNGSVSPVVSARLFRAVR